MYDVLAILALFVFLYSMIAGRLERTVISGPIIFVTAGILMGPLGLGWFNEDVSDVNFRIFADLTLAVILFIDAANIDFSIKKSLLWIPVRMLLFGLPGVIFLGTIFAAIIFNALSIFEAAILGTMLAATDAALGKAVITDKTVPTQVRQGLNLESGLNDVVAVKAVDHINMQRDAAMRGQRLKELAHQFRIKRAYLVSRKRHVPHQIGPRRQIKRTADLRVIHRKVKIAIAADAPLIAQGLRKRLAQRDADIFDRVVIIDV